MENLYKLEAYRKELNLSRRELELLSGVKQQTIQALEQGITDVNNVKLSTLIKLSKALHCKVVDLLGNELKRYIC